MKKRKSGIVHIILSSVYVAFWVFCFVYMITERINYDPDGFDFSAFVNLLVFISVAGLVDALIVLFSVISYYSKKHGRSVFQKRAALYAFSSSVSLILSVIFFLNIFNIRLRNIEIAAFILWGLAIVLFILCFICLVNISIERSDKNKPEENHEQ